MQIVRANYECVVNGQVQHCTITYNPMADPYSVEFVFLESKTVWVFGRELMKSALTGPAGEGDVKIRTVDRWYIIQFNVNGAKADVAFVKSDMFDLTQIIYTVVPEEAESGLVDWESEIARLL